MAENTVKKYYDDSQRQIDEQAIADKFNAATVAQYNVQREQNRQAENQFYNQMYNTQQTAMDTIRKSNAAAVSTGASRGVQAANELSAILGLEQESVAGATELAQANRQTAQEETAAVLENMLKAYQQASQERQNYVQNAIQSASVDVEQQKAAAMDKEANVKQQEIDLRKEEIAANAEANKAAQELENARYMMDLKINDPMLYYQKQAEQNNAQDITNLDDAQANRNLQNMKTAIMEINNKGGDIDKRISDWDTVLQIYGFTAAESDAITKYLSLSIAAGLLVDNTSQMLNELYTAKRKGINLADLNKK